MTLNDIEDCEECPLLKEEICKGGWTSGYGGIPIEPPCASIDGDKDLNEYIEEYHINESEYEEYLDRKYKEEQERQLKNKIAKERRTYSDLYCYKERHEVKRLKKAIKSAEAAISLAETFASAFNITNEMFGYSERKKVNQEAKDHLDKLKEQLNEAEKALKKKRKECKNTQKYKEIGEKSK